MHFLSIAALAGLTSTVVAQDAPLGGFSKGEVTFEDLKPFAQLHWVPCYQRSGNFTCANLEVPLDYDAPQNSTTNIAFIKHSAANSSAEDLLVNPGGPGVSGIFFAIKNAVPLRKVGVPANYNIIGFDPRGVQNSGPDLDCFPGQPGVRDLYDNVRRMSIAPNNQVMLAESLAQAKAFGKWCSKVHEGGKAGYAGTMAVVRDLEHFTNLRAVERGVEPGDAKLNFWGGSYGTVIGATFAALYPDRVGKMVLNSVVDVQDYYNGDRLAGIDQLDRIIETFFSTCYDVGALCYFGRPSKSVEEIRTRFNAVLADLDANPIAFYDPGVVQYPVVVTARNVKKFLHHAAYDPGAQWKGLDVIMTYLEQRNATALVRWYKMGVPPTSQCEYEAMWDKTGSKASGAYDGSTALHIIRCIDANGSFNISTVQEYSDNVNFNEGLSKYGGAGYAVQGAVMCGSLKLKVPQSQVFRGFNDSIKTATPILFTENILDPVTPAAEKMSTFFQGSVVLQANGTGHGVCMAPACSKCIFEYHKKYWETGEVPPPNTLCQVEDITKPWGGLQLDRKETEFNEAVFREPLIWGPRWGLGW